MAHYHMIHTYLVPIQSAFQQKRDLATNPKSSKDLAPHFLIEGIRNPCRSYKGIRLTTPQPCPGCGGQNYRKHHEGERTFARLITRDGFEEVTVEYRHH